MIVGAKLVELEDDFPVFIIQSHEKTSRSGEKEIIKRAKYNSAALKYLAELEINKYVLDIIDPEQEGNYRGYIVPLKEEELAAGLINTEEGTFSLASRYICPVNKTWCQNRSNVFNFFKEGKYKMETVPGTAEGNIYKRDIFLFSLMEQTEPVSNDQ